MDCSIDGCTKRVQARGWCSMHLSRWYKTGDPLQVTVIRGDDERRFWSKVVKTPTCWRWDGGFDRNGYGRFDWNGRHGFAHRYAWELAHGQPPPARDYRIEIDHRCRNRACVRPGHLELVTRRENVRRGSSFAGVYARTTHCPANHPYDEANTWVQTKPPARRCRQCQHNRSVHPGEDCYGRLCARRRHSASTS